MKYRPLAAEQQIVKLGPTVGREADDLAVEHTGHRPHRVRDLGLQHRKLCVDVPATGDEFALVALHVREGTEPVVLQFEDPIVVIERLGDANERHRPDACAVHATKRSVPRRHEAR